MKVTVGDRQERGDYDQYPVVRQDGRILFVHVYAPDDARIMVPSPLRLAQHGAALTQDAAIAAAVALVKERP